MFDVSSPFGTYAFKITYFGGNDIYHDGLNNDVVLIDEGLVSVAEPRAFVTFACGMLGVFALRLSHSDGAALRSGEGKRIPSGISDSSPSSSTSPQPARGRGWPGIDGLVQ